MLVVLGDETSRRHMLASAEMQPYALLKGVLPRMRAEIRPNDANHVLFTFGFTLYWVAC